jgi:hypothetical protein
MKSMKLAFAAGVALALLAGRADAQQVPYVWDSVAIGGGGFVTAVVPSRAAPGVAYARTDVGGAYRWDSRRHRWFPLLDWVAEDQTGFLGIDALAVDPRDADNIWLLAGIAYLNGGRTAILHSTDAGKTFAIVDVTNQFKTSPSIPATARRCMSARAATACSRASMGAERGPA